MVLYGVPWETYEGILDALGEYHRVTIPDLLPILHYSSPTGGPFTYR